MPPKKTKKKSQNPPQPSSSSSSGAVEEKLPLDIDIHREIKADYDRALSCHRKGNTTKALSIIKDSLSRHTNCPSLLLLQTSIYLHLSSLSSSSSSASLKHFQNAVVSFNLYASLSPPLGIGLSLLFNRRRFELAKNEDDYREVIDRCVRDLLMEDPVDPLEEIVLGYEGFFKDCKGKEERIKKVRKEMENLLKAANKAIPEGKKSVKERTEANLLNTLELAEGAAKVFERNESFKDKAIAIKQEIKLLKSLQQKMRLENEGEEERNLEELRRIAGKLDTKMAVIDYWRKLSSGEKRRILEVKINDILELCGDKKPPVKFLMEAIQFAVANGGKWKFWRCICKQTFTDSEAWKEHAVSEHIGRLSEEEEMFVPKEEVDSDCVDKIVNGVWRPVDLFKYSEMAQERQTIDEENWPFCDDADRQRVLRQIRAKYVSFLDHKCLAPSILKMVRQYSMYAINKTPIPGIQDLMSPLEQNPMIVCFVEHESLMEMFRWLEQMYSACFPNGPHDKGGSSKPIEERAEVHEAEIYSDETIVLTDNFSGLLLDEQLLRLGGKLDIRYGSSSTAADDGRAVASSANEDTKDDRLRDSDHFTHWLYAGDAIGKELLSWTVLRTYKKAQAWGAFRAVQKEFAKLRSLCHKKINCLYLNYACLTVETMCIDEETKRLEISEHVPRCFASILFKHYEGLVGVSEASSSSELKVIREVLKSAEAFRDNKFILKDEVIHLDRLSDSELSEDEKWKLEAKLWEIDDAFRVAFWKCKCSFIVQIRVLDASIMKTTAEMKCMEQSLMAASLHSFLPIVLDILKSFLRARLVHIVEEEVEAKEKADTAKSA